MVHCLRGLEQRNQFAIAHQFELVLFVVVGPFTERVRQARRGGRRAEREGLYLFHEVLKAAALLCRTVILLLHLLIMRINSQFNFIDRKQTDSCDLSCTRSLAWHHCTIIHCQVFITSPIKTALLQRAAPKSHNDLILPILIILSVPTYPKLSVFCQQKQSKGDQCVSTPGK